MKLSDFDYNLPKELIAQYPLENRDDAKLLVLDRRKGSIEHRVFKDIREYFQPQELLVLNNTKVLSCRLKARRTSNGAVEALLLNRKSGSTFNALLKPSRLKLGEKIIFDGGKIYGVISAKNEITFNTDDQDSIYGLGEMPLPPYIKRDAEVLDREYYQTVYAKEQGAVASPTAGLHFTKRLINEIRAFGVQVTYITLHVGIGTFRLVKTEDIREHKMEPEYFKICDEAAGLIEKARSQKKRIIAVGTTSLRAIESYAQQRSEGNTDLFIYPGYEFKITGSLLTNFHLPRTTLFMLVCAFAGSELIRKAYQQAIEKKYRFYSYGDAMLIL